MVFPVDKKSLWSLFCTWETTCGLYKLLLCTQGLFSMLVFTWDQGSGCREYVFLVND